MESLKKNLSASRSSELSIILEASSVTKTLSLDVQ